MAGAALFVVEGDAIAQGSKRAIAKGVTVDDAPELKAWREKIALVARSAGWRQPIDGPVALGLLFVRERPASHYLRTKRARAYRVLRTDAPAFPAVPRDLDKLQRAVFDALTGVCWTDDSRVVIARPLKLYGPLAGVAIIVRPIVTIAPAGGFDLDLRRDDAFLERVCTALDWWPRHQGAQVG